MVKFFFFNFFRISRLTLTAALGGGTSDTFFKFFFQVPPTKDLALAGWSGVLFFIFLEEKKTPAGLF
jgi:hypothetical protein